MNDIKDLVKLQREFFKTGKSRSFSFRQAALIKLQQSILAHESEIFQALKADLNKPELEAYSTEVAYIKNELKHVLKNLKTWTQPRKISSPLVVLPAKSEIFSEPFGCTLIISPWNYPYQLAISPLIGAIAAGNTVILKPSEMTPHTDRVIGKIIRESFEPGHVACIHGGVSETQSLLDERFDFIFFTGSTRVGQIVLQKASKHLTPVCLELGGKSPCIVDKNIDLKVAANRIAWGKFMNAGQTCVAPDYIYVHEDISEAFLKELSQSLKNQYGENPRQSQSLARIVNHGHFDRLVNLMKDATVFHGGDFDRNDKYISPTILTDVTWDHPVMQEEIFGPILPVMIYRDLQTVMDAINQQGKPLAFYVFSKNKSLQDLLILNCSFGGACINDCIVHLANPDLPFGGVGESGMGAYHGKASFDIFSHKKSVLRKPFWGDATMRYPPYTSSKMKLLRFFLG